MNKYRWNWLLHQRIWCEWMNHTIGKTNNHCYNITAITNKIEEYMCDYNYSNAINRHLQIKRQDQNRTGQARPDKSHEIWYDIMRFIVTKYTLAICWYEDIPKITNDETIEIWKSAPSWRLLGAHTCVEFRNDSKNEKLGACNWMNFDEIRSYESFISSSK